MKRVQASLFAGALLVGCGARTTPGHGDVADAAPDAPAMDSGTVQLHAEKVDLLFMIDNSSSMGEKLTLLQQTVPTLLERFATPNCIDKSKPAAPPAPRDAQGNCPSGTLEEFPAVHDLHVGVVTSSLGGGGADTCAEGAKNPIPQLAKFDRHNDDKGHLINRKRPDLASPPASGVEDTVPNAVPKSGNGGNFLAWLPAIPANSGQPDPIVPREPTFAQLEQDFGTLVVGAQEFGCGLEAQLESFYRFLIQPDPYDSIQLDLSISPARATLVGVDATILKQRADFLRPDSLLAVFVVTDEEDSWSDPLSVSGRGWSTRAVTFPGSPTGFMPRGTSPCNTNPNDAACTSCAFAGHASDPNCQISCGPGCAGWYTAADDNLNVRYTNDMKQRFGLDPQFPIARYVAGLTDTHVPNREGEHAGGAGPYKDSRNCQNPIFAKSLPTDPNGELCALAPGPRNPSLVYFAIVGGVPWQLTKDKLDASDWVKILGKDPGNFVYDGRDPHMQESYLPRAGIAAGPSASDTADPIHGREWDTTTSQQGLDLQYACSFPLPAPKDCSDPAVRPTCDCGKNPKGTFVTSPICEPNPNDAGNPTLQVRGKAYPSIRELRLAQALGDRAVVASICPHIDPNGMLVDDGYRSAMRLLIDRARPALVQ